MLSYDLCTSAVRLHLLIRQRGGAALTVRGGGREGSHTLRSGASVRIATCDLVAASLCQDRHHRKLAVGSIICGCTPIGVVSLINSVKAREARNADNSEQYSRKAKKYGILSIVVWVTFLIMLPVLVVLGSYLLTLIE
ncbi:hypothetical protein CRUP_008502 [Coryphaenoides rupestris]|nr:hypothetical protein CRUP_008502 [Coryphaenoides rupestris]